MISKSLLLHSLFIDVKDFWEVPKSQQQTKHNFNLYLHVANERLEVELFVFAERFEMKVKETSTL